MSRPRGRLPARRRDECLQSDTRMSVVREREGDGRAEEKRSTCRAKSAAHTGSAALAHPREGLRIIDRANVGRATFYAHFDNKDDLLVSGFEDLRASLKARQREALSRGRTIEDRVFGFSQDVFAHTNEYRDVFRVMVGKRSGTTVERLLHKLVADLVREDVRESVDAERNAVPAEALVQFIAGALFGMLMWWLDDKAKLSATEINALFRRLAIPALKTATVTT